METRDGTDPAATGGGDHISSFTFISYIRIEHGNANKKIEAKQDRVGELEYYYYGFIGPAILIHTRQINKIKQ